MKRAISLILALVLLLGVLPARATAAQTNPFTDVKPKDYFYDAVLWAVENKITSGTSANKFSPKKPCTREQVVTFLNRALGNPMPSTFRSCFADIKSQTYSYYPILWAAETGVTTGTDRYQFSPKKVCTRGQVVTFLWRAVGSPEPEALNCPFTDVKSSAYYYKAMLWAVQNGITTGTSETKFSPNAECSRAQVVTFLYRTVRNTEVNNTGIPSDGTLTIVTQPLDVEFNEKTAVMSITVSGTYSSVTYTWEKRVLDQWRNVTTLNNDKVTYSVSASALSIVSDDGQEGIGEYRCTVTGFNSAGAKVGTVISRTASVEGEVTPIEGWMNFSRIIGAKYYTFHNNYRGTEDEVYEGFRIKWETSSYVLQSHQTTADMNTMLLNLCFNEGIPAEFFDYYGNDEVANALLFSRSPSHVAYKIVNVSGGTPPYTFEWQLGDNFDGGNPALIEGVNCVGQGTREVAVFAPLGQNPSEPVWNGYVQCKVTDARGRTGLIRFFSRIQKDDDAPGGYFWWFRYFFLTYLGENNSFFTSDKTCWWPTNVIWHH